jgi:hypothetical protein
MVAGAAAEAGSEYSGGQRLVPDEPGDFEQRVGECLRVITVDRDGIMAGG